ncbi:hypothetical protein [Azospirillum humicireducens]|nr:hypothetical protein [Azospirillum humicireducens]
MAKLHGQAEATSLTVLLCANHWYFYPVAKFSMLEVMVALRLFVLPALLIAANIPLAQANGYAKEYLQRVRPGMSEASVRGIFSEIRCDEVRERLHQDRVNGKTQDRLNLECVARNLYSPYSVDFSPLSEGRKAQSIRYFWIDVRDEDMIAVEVAETIGLPMVKKEWQNTLGKIYPCWFFENNAVRAPLCHNSEDEGYRVWHLGYTAKR